jgi:CDP-glucose 4,6-dehydratase
MDNFWKNKKVFVTGANGFLGSHLTSALIQKGVRPVVLLYEENPGGLFEQQRLASNTEVVWGDICDLALIEKVLRDHNIEIVFHLAAQAIVDQALEDPLATFEANIKGTWNMLEAAKKSSTVKKIVVASSDKAYGEHTSLPYKEDEHRLKGLYPYEVSKVCADLISYSFYRAFNLPVSITRCGNLYGPGDLKMNRLIPRTISQLHHDQAPIIRDTGASMRDYLYVGDAAEAYILLAEKMDKNFHGEAFNFSTNMPLSVAEVIATISREMSKDIEPVVIQTHGMEIRHQYASFDKAKRMLGWEPKHSLMRGLEKTIPWYVEHLINVHANNEVVLSK